MSPPPSRGGVFGLPTGERILDALFRVEGDVLLTGPFGPDGDSLGACLALARVLQRHGITVHVAGDAAARYRPLPGYDTLTPDADVRPGPWAAVVICDGDRHRLAPTVKAAFDAAGFRGIVDHHRSTTPDGYHEAWLDPSASSACEMLACLFEARGIAIDTEMAALLFAGIAFDTGNFRYSNTTPSTMRRAADLLEHGFDHASLVATMLVERRREAMQLAAETYQSVQLVCGGQLALARVPRSSHDRLGLVAGDLEGLVDNLVHIAGAHVACLVIDRPEGGVKLSLRSRGAVDVAAIAQALAPTGGGHAKAAGVLLEGDADRIDAMVREQVQELVAAAIACDGPGVSRHMSAGR